MRQEQRQDAIKRQVIDLDVGEDEFFSVHVKINGEKRGDGEGDMGKMIKVSRREGT